MTFFITISALFVMFIIFHMFLQRLLSNKANFFSFTLLGYGAFGFFDIAKYNILGYQLRPLSDWAITATVTCILLSFISFLASYKYAYPAVRHFFPRFSGTFRKGIFVREARKYRYSSSNWKHIILFIVILLLLSMFIFYRYRSSTYFSLINYAFKATIILCFAMYGFSKKPIFIILTIVLFAISMTDSSRRAFIVVVFPLLLLYIDRFNYYNRKVTKKKKVIIVAILVIFFLFLNYMRSTHDFGDGYVAGNKIANTVAYVKTMKSIDTFYNTGFIIENFPKPFAFFFGETYTSLVFGLIPRSMWEGKPVGLGAPLGLMQRYGERDFDYELWMETNQLSLSPGFVGEAYANFGVIGVLGTGILLGLLAHGFDRKLLLHHKFSHLSYPRIRFSTVPYLPVMTSFCLIIRGDLYSAMIYAVVMFVFSKACLRLLKINSSSTVEGFIAKTT